MIFLGYTFASDRNSFGSNTATPPHYTSVTVGNCIADNLYATLEIGDEVVESDTWTFDTVMNADFNGNLLAGNIKYYVSEIDCMRLKRRLKGSLNWQTVYEKLIETSSDFKFEWHDLTVRGRSVYEYSVVPAFGNVEGEFFAQSIRVEFNGLYLMDYTGVYSTELEIKLSESNNNKRSIIEPINRRYPYVVSNGANNYSAGNVSGYFVEKYDNPEDTVSDVYDTIGGHVYRRAFKNFMYNRCIKLMKIDDGRMWLIEVSSSQITHSEQGVQDFVTTSFDWTEVGDCDKVEDLAMTGLV